MQQIVASGTSLAERIRSGKPILVVEVSPPLGADPAAVRDSAACFAGRVHALGVSDNRDRVRMSALAAAAVLAGEGVEPILHVNARDRNRIALVSEALGARALGIGNILCTSGSHQTLGSFRAAKNVFDLDPVQMLQALPALTDGPERFCLGAVASPDADPLDLQIVQLSKKVAAGAQFLITQPVYDLERFDAWWARVVRRGLHERAAILATIRPLLGDALVDIRSGKRPRPRIPDAILQRIAAKADAAADRRAAIDLAVETADRLSAVKGLRGLSISADGDHDAALEIIGKIPAGSD